MQTIVAALFLIAYLGIALGRIPGLALDRTGIALLGAAAMVAIGALTTAQALASINIPTILPLYFSSFAVGESQWGIDLSYAAANFRRKGAVPLNQPPMDLRPQRTMKSCSVGQVATGGAP